MKIIAVGIQKGGSGKTTTATNLGGALSLYGKKVLIIDMDPQGNATTCLGIDKQDLKHTIYDVLLKGLPIDDAIIETGFENLSIIPSNLVLTDAETELLNKFSRETVLKNSLETLKTEFDYILIDCPPSLGNLTVNALVSANSVLIPLEAAELGMEGTEQFLATFNLVRYINKNLDIEGVLLTRVDVNTSSFKQYQDELKGIFGNKVYDVYISRNVSLANAQSFKNFDDERARPAVFAYPNAKGSMQYMELAKAVMLNG